MLEESCHESLQKRLSEMKEWEHEWFIRGSDELLRNLMLYAKKGELAIKRDETIQKWMQSDRERDEFYERTNPKRYPLCVQCNGDMDVILKDPSFAHDKKERHRILFMFECKKCTLRRAFYDNGEELSHEKEKCEKCWRTELKSEIIREEKETIYRDTCQSCHHVKEDRFKHYIPEEDLNFARDREKYVLSEKKIEEYKDAKWRLGELDKLFKDIDARKAREAQWWEVKEEKVIIEKKVLDVSDMKDLVIKGLKKMKYKDISFSNPVVFKRWVNIELSVAGKWLDKKEFQELIQWSLENTNWKINEKSILINLGILQCKLEGE